MVGKKAKKVKKVARPKKEKIKKVKLRDKKVDEKVEAPIEDDPWKIQPKSADENEAFLNPKSEDW